MQASSALTPSHGSAEAWEALPVYSKVTRTMPSRSWWSRVRSKPWIIMAASTSLKTPALISLTLPPPPSSAGVPITWMRRAGPRARGGDDVVATGVADAGQRVVLAEDGDGGAGAGLDGGAEGRVHAADAFLHLEAVRTEELREPAAGLDLRVAQLGVVEACG